MELQIGSHCKYKIRYHIVWGVKYARRLLFGPRVTFLKKVLEEIGERYDYTIEVVGVDKSHVHVFAGAHPTVPPAKLIQVLKSISAKRMFEQFPDIKRFLWGGAFWSIGNYVSTVSDGPIESVIKQYIKKQGKKGKLVKDPGSKVYQLKLVPLLQLRSSAP